MDRSNATLRITILVRGRGAVGRRRRGPLPRRRARDRPGVPASPATDRLSGARLRHLRCPSLATRAHPLFGLIQLSVARGEHGQQAKRWSAQWTKSSPRQPANDHCGLLRRHHGRWRSTASSELRHLPMTTTQAAQQVARLRLPVVDEPWAWRVTRPLTSGNVSGSARQSAQSPQKASPGRRRRPLAFGRPSLATGGRRCSA
jgi:hypothetical protein